MSEVEVELKETEDLSHAVLYSLNSLGRKLDSLDNKDCLKSSLEKLKNALDEFVDYEYELGVHNIE